MKPKLVIVLGPTAVGKSDVVLELASEINAEIINADAQQVYRQMDIGTAKPSLAEREKVPHHLIDIVDPDGEFNVAMFRQLATASANDIGRKKQESRLFAVEPDSTLGHSRKACSSARHKIRQLDIHLP